MKIKEILAKVAKGEALTDAEKEFLTKYEEPKPDASKVTQLEQEKADLANQLKTFQDKESEREAEALKNKPEVDQLRAQLSTANETIKTLTKERDTARTEKVELERDNSIRAIASDSKFKNFEFLKFNLTGAKVDLTNKEAVKAHMEQLRKDNPELFSAEVNGGGGGSNTGNNGGGGVVSNTKYEEAKKTGDIGSMLANAPEAK